MQQTDSAKQKPLVLYRGEPEFYSVDHDHQGETWEYARVYGLNHPYLGECDIRTSQVLRKFDGGFETRNTIYQREQ
jgi:hypothetical protein